ncbi:MAG: alpha/beta hydrolase, partial [Arenicellales bacterium]
MKINITDVLKKILAISAYTVFGAVLGIIILYVYLMQNRPDLHPWHTLSLEEEFTIKSTAKIKTFPEYLAQEEKLFDELQEKIYNNGTDKHEHQLIRYDPTSMANPFLYETNWNRSFELKQENPAGGVLLLHGLSDSPYSLRELANTLHQQGNYVLGLRMPGHGTVPSGLVDASWQDMAAAVKIAVRHLSDKIGSRHLHIIGYSMG